MSSESSSLVLFSAVVYLIHQRYRIAFWNLLNSQNHGVMAKYDNFMVKKCTFFPVSVSKYVNIAESLPKFALVNHNWAWQQTVFYLRHRGNRISRILSANKTQTLLTFWLLDFESTRVHTPVISCWNLHFAPTCFNRYPIFGTSRRQPNFYVSDCL